MHMPNMSGFMGNTSVPPYLKVMAASLLAVTYVAILVYVGFFAAAHGWSMDNLPPMVSFLLGTGMTVALQILNIHVGASVAENSPSAPQALRLPVQPSVVQPIVTPVQGDSNASPAAS